MNLQTGTIIAVLVCMICGVAVGIQVTSNTIAGKALGSLPTGLFVNIMGGIISILIVLILLLTGRFIDFGLIKDNIGYLTVSGALGLCIITGIAFSMPRIGVAAGLAVIITGQMLIAAIVDSKGLGGVEQIPITPARILGLFLMLVGMWFLLPKK